MNDKETIKNRFVNFEPEVDDFVISQKWEKIKYFVPQKEKKKRAAIFFLYGTLALLLLSSLILTISSQKIILDGSEKEKYTAQKNKAITNDKTIALQNAGSKKNLNETLSEKKVAGQNIPLISHQKKSAINSISSAFKKEVSTPSETNSNKNIVFANPDLNQKTVELIATKNSFENDTFMYDHLPLLPFQILIPEKNDEITSAFNPNYYLPKPISSISIDLFGGITNSKKNSISYLAGVGANYHLRNKFSLTGQFIYNSTNFNYKNTDIENKITKQVISITSSPSSAQIDTTYYIQAFTNYIIRSAASYNFALGTEYKILQKNRLSLSAFALFNLNSTKYTYGYTREYGKEVFVYLNGNPNPPSSNLVSSTFKEGDYLKEENRISTGLMPGMLFGYKLNNKTSLIFKPTYLIELAETNLIINSSAFKLKGNRFLVNVGFRINL